MNPGTTSRRHDRARPRLAGGPHDTPAAIIAARIHSHRNDAPAAAPLPTIKLASRLLEPAPKAETAGRPRVAAFVGVAPRRCGGFRAAPV
jgi:hypothetical protein